MALKLLTTLLRDHFAGGKNLSRGHEKGISQDLTALLNGLVGNSNDLAGKANLFKLTSAASAGGGATENDVVVTGLLTTDVILSVSQRVPGGNNLAPIGWADQKAGSLDLTWTGDPGAGAIVEVLVLRVVV